ncbi:MAG TPA: TlpA disulfide reductase family protein, partial [Candidatus Solibacter sp.]|nr:TlpA disulfide reductase family protein [Candidatus Solibacter sp.]
CQYAAPFLQRLHQLHGDQRVTLVGISQDAAKPTAAFMKEFGATFPVLLDEPDRYPVSNAYGLTNVPTVFWINQSFEIEISSVSWSKAEMEAIHRKMAETGGAVMSALFRADEEIRDYRPG